MEANGLQERPQQTNAFPGTAHRLDLTALFEGDDSRLKRFATKFWQRVDGGTLDECRPWTRQVFEKTGYGRVEISLPRKSRKVLYAHRLAWALANGNVIPERVLVRHSCRTATCCNPEELTSQQTSRNRGPRDETE
jgi:hypothetical protein